MNPVDAWVLNKIEGFAHWTQTTFGISADFWRRVCYVIALAYYTFCITLKNIELIPKNHSAGWTLPLNAYLTYMITRAIVTDNPWMTGGDTMNALKIRLSFTRTILLVMTVGLGWTDIKASNYWFEFYVLAIYFEACDILPWSKSKVRQFLENLVSNKNLVPIGAN